MPQFRHMSQYSAIYRFNSYYPLLCNKELNAKLSLNMPVYNAIKAMFIFLVVPETQCIIYRPDLHNSQASRNNLKK